ncbi:MAG TPA: hypothetical protein VFS30_10700 [Dehalococcoidia bacterium]|nr:hypothetical protein [Dehalococcoidia bacterium]
MPDALLLHLPTPEDIWWIPRPPESHHVFGAGLLLVAALIAAEALAGEVWHRSMVRRMMFPGILIFLGWGLVLVAFIEPYARLVHVSMGLPMIVGGWAEARYRLGEIDRKFADALIVPALGLAAFDTLSFHTTGDLPVVISHIGVGLVVLLVAGLRLYQSAQPQSAMRSLLISGALTLLAGNLWLDAFFQSNV